MKRIVLFAVATCVTTAAIFAQATISAKDASRYIGNKVRVYGKVLSTRNDNSKPVLIYLGGDSGSSQVNVVISQDDAKNFPYKPEEYLSSKNIYVTGEVSSRNGKVEMLVRKSDSIKIDEGGESEIRPLTFEGINRYFREK